MNCPICKSLDTKQAAILNSKFYHPENYKSLGVKKSKIDIRDHIYYCLECSKLLNFYFTNDYTVLYVYDLNTDYEFTIINNKMHLHIFDKNESYFNSSGIASISIDHVYDLTIDKIIDYMNQFKDKLLFGN